MAEHIVKIISAEWVTHNVRRFRVEKPGGYRFIPGQATYVSINTEDLKKNKHPFTFTCLNDDDYLEFTIKIYTERNGVTKELGTLKPGDELIIRRPWGTIQYMGEGIFIAGGAGVTPFIAIFRQLQKDQQLGNNKLIYSNKTEHDIILRKEFESMLGDNFINTLTEETKEGFEHHYINFLYLKEHINNFRQYFYVCGPDSFVASIKNDLIQLGANPDMVIFEQ